MDERSGASRIDFTFDLGGIHLIIEGLRIALLNPHRLSGKSADSVRTVIDFMINHVDEKGFPANAELLRGTAIRVRFR
jgi:hypothetical protein